jgi:Uma2 family endonuclease
VPECLDYVSTPAGAGSTAPVVEWRLRSAKIPSMTAAKKLNLITEDEYLASELKSEVKHEYLGGVVYAMAGARNRHNLISGQVFGALFVQLRGKPCTPRNSDTKVRLRMPGHARYYYPDASVVCQPNPEGDSFEDHPRAIFEVLSPGTRRIDEGEKKDAYLTIPSLAVYAMVEQTTPAIVAYRRTDQGFVREVYEGIDAIVPLREIGVGLPLAEVYEALQFPPLGEEPDEES